MDDSSQVHLQATCSHELDNFLLGVEAKGDIFGTLFALPIGEKFIPQRKPKKLPGIYFCVGNLYLSAHLK